MFLLLIPGLLGRSVNFKIPKRFLCRRPVFPNYLSFSCDYGSRMQHLIMTKTVFRKQNIKKLIILNSLEKVLHYGIATILGDSRLHFFDFQGKESCFTQMYHTLSVSRKTIITFRNSGVTNYRYSVRTIGG